LFFEQTATLLDYLTEHTVLCLHGDLDAAAQTFWAEAQSRYRLLAHDVERPILKPEALLIKAEDFFAATHRYSRLILQPKQETRLIGLDIERRAEQPLHKLQDFLKKTRKRVFIGTDSLGRRETVAQLFADQGLEPVLCETWQE